MIKENDLIWSKGNEDWNKLHVIPTPEWFD
jgi:hypothetical protein